MNFAWRTYTSYFLSIKDINIIFKMLHGFSSESNSEVKEEILIIPSQILILWRNLHFTILLFLYVLILEVFKPTCIHLHYYTIWLCIHLHKNAWTVPRNTKHTELKIQWAQTWTKINTSNSCFNCSWTDSLSVLFKVAIYTPRVRKH